MLYGVILYLAVTLVIGLLSKKKKHDSKAFHGANLSVLICVVVGAGEWMGGTSTTGVSEYGYLWGLSGAWYTIANGIGIMLCAICFAKLYRRLDTPTVSGIVGHYIGTRARKVASIILIIVMMVVGISQMIAIGTLGQILFGIDMTVSILALGFFVIFYTLLGGMVSIGYTNVLHMCVLYIGMLIAVIYCLNDVGGISAMTEKLPSSYFNMTNIGLPKVSSWILASVLGACTAQAGIQPILAAKDERVAVKSSVIIALIVAPFGILSACMGMIAKIKFPDLANAKLALPTLMQHMSPVTSGIVMAALLAAILSTAAPIFLACGTLFTKDIYLSSHPDIEKNKELRISRLVTAISGTVCAVGAVLLHHNSVILDIVYVAYSLRGSLFVILLFGIFSSKTKISENTAIISMIATAIVGLFWVSFKLITGTYPISAYFNETYATVLTAFLTMTAGKCLSRRSVLTNAH